MKAKQLSAVTNGSCFHVLVSIQGHRNPIIAGLISTVDKVDKVSQQDRSGCLVDAFTMESVKAARIGAGARGHCGASAEGVAVSGEGFRLSQCVHF